MSFPANWQNPITATPSQLQSDVDPLQLLPSRHHLSQLRLDAQQALLDSGTERHTRLQVTPEGVIWDGHHAVRVAAENGMLVTVQVVNVIEKPASISIMNLQVS